MIAINAMYTDKEEFLQF